MSSFITLKKTDKNFNKYIWGNFSNSEMALPVQSLNSDKQQDSVTFEIVNKNKIKKPSALIVYMRLIKWNYFFLIFVPLFYVFIKNFVYQRLFDPFDFGFAAISSLFLFAGLNIRNDVLDHVSGFDRIIKSSKEKPISLGWVTALKANYIGWCLILIAVLLAVPVCIHQNEAFRVAIVVFILFISGNFLNKNNYKFNYFSEFILFIILGPGLCSGYQVSMGSGVDTEILVFGTAWGVAVLFLLYIVQFSNLFETSQAGIQNTLTKMGFDKSKLYLKIWWSLFLVLWIGYHYFYSSQYWLLFGTGILVFWSLPVFIRITNAHSPMGSDLSRVRRSGFRIFILMTALLILEQSWYLYTHFDWIS